MTTAIERILGRLSESDDAVTSKTAAAVEVTPDARMLETLRRVSESSKTASVSAAAEPVKVASEVERMAKEAAAAEEAAMLKQAHFMGAAFADGFMERYAQYGAALESAGVKTASVSGGTAGTALTQDLLDKVAAEAAKKAITEMEKRAEEEFNRGYEEQLQAVQKTAAEVHFAGQKAANAIVTRIRASK